MDEKLKTYWEKFLDFITLHHEVPIHMLLLSFLTGLLGGIGAIVFRSMIAFFHNLFFYQRIDIFYNADKHSLPSPLGWFVMFVPPLAGMVVVYIVQNYAIEAKGFGTPEVLHAIYYRKGKLRPRIIGARILASSISIGAGGSVGREGPIVQIGGVIGSTLGQIFKLEYWQIYTLIASGAGGGIGAAFNTPLAGVVYALEVISPEASVRTIIPAIISAGVASYVGRLWWGNKPSFIVENTKFIIPSIKALPFEAIAFYTLLGILVGIGGAMYVYWVYYSETVFIKISKNPYIRHFIGMTIVGFCAVMFMHFTGHYYVQGIGYATVQDVLNQVIKNAWFLIFLFFMKLLLTGVSLGSGGSGGVFSPGIFMGATLGGGVGLLAKQIDPHIPINMVSSGVVGIAAMLSSTVSAPITAVVMSFEMTRDYRVVVPSMIAAGVAFGVRRMIIHYSIDTFKLEKQGFHIPEIYVRVLHYPHKDD